MLGNRFIAYNSTDPTTAVLAGITSGTAIETMLQVQAPADKEIYVVEWGISFDADSGGAVCELINSKAVAASGLTAHDTGSVMPYDGRSQLSNVQMGTGATGFSDGVVTEGTLASPLMWDVQTINYQYVKQYQLGIMPVLDAAQLMRIRIHSVNDVQCRCYIVWSE